MSLVTTSEGSTLGAPAAAAYEALNRAFTAHFGYRLEINSGSRTYAQQEAIFRSSYRPYFIANTSRRWWLGQWWYLIPGRATVAVPGTSNHEYPPGKAADFGSGVQTRYTAQHNWMLANAGAYGWEWTGRTFVTIEPWHWEKNWPQLAGLDSKPFEPPTNATPPAVPTRKGDDVPTFIKTAEHGHYSVAPGVCIAIANPAYIDSVVHVAAQTPGGPLPLVLSISPDNLVEWLFNLSGVPSNRIPAPNYAWYAAVEYQHIPAPSPTLEEIVAGVDAVIEEPLTLDEIAARVSQTTVNLFKDRL